VKPANRIMKILVNFFDNITSASVNKMTNFITQQIFTAERSGHDIQEIIIQIKSGGGESDAGLFAFNFLKNLNIKKTTINLGNVDSAAVLLYCSGDNRLVTEHSRFVLHESTINLNGNFSKNKLKETSDYLKQINEDYINIISNTLVGDYIDIRKEISEGYIIDSKKSIELGLSKEIINNFYLNTTADVQGIIIDGLENLKK
jgi:ATP-dependent Clp protease protease subunit